MKQKRKKNIHNERSEVYEMMSDLAPTDTSSGYCVNGIDLEGFYKEHDRKCAESEDIEVKCADYWKTLQRRKALAKQVMALRGGAK